MEMAAAKGERAAARLLFLPPLCCVAVIVKHEEDEDERRPRELVDSLPHVVVTISAFLNYGCAPIWTIPRACEHNFMGLLRRLASREHVNMNAHYRAYLSSKGLVHAVRNDNMEMVQWLYSTYCPTDFVWKGVEEAAAMGNVAMLKWFTQHQSYRFVDRFCSVIDLTAKNGHLGALTWIYNHIPGHIITRVSS